MRLLPLIKSSVFAVTLAFASGVFVSFVNAKPGAPITLRSDNAYQIPAYSNASMEIEFTLPQKPGHLQVQLQTHEDISILNQESVQEYLLRGDEPVLSLPLEIEVSAAGKYYLLFNLILTDERGLSEAVALSIRLLVGDQDGQNAQQKPSPSSGIKTLPAVETIK